MPKETKAYVFLSNRDIIEQNDRIGIESILVKNVQPKSVTGKVVIIANNRILIKRIGFKSVKVNRVFAKCKVFRCNYLKAVIDNRFKRTL